MTEFTPADGPIPELQQPVKKKKPGRGIQTLFRVCMRHHTELSAIADNKANIMLSINAIIITIVLSSLLPKFPTQPHLVTPTIILLVVCVVAVILATLSTMPHITSGAVTREDIKNRTANLLFFGNFHKMPMKDFEWGINELLDDREFLYGSLTRDFYNLGKVLSAKYRYLRICYLVFGGGLVVSVISFILAHLSL